MNKILKQIQTELRWMKKTYKTKTKHVKNRFADTLDLMQTLEKNKLFLNFRFYFYHEQSSLGCHYEIIANTKKKTQVREKYTFSDAENRLLPGIDMEDSLKLKSAFKFHRDKNIVKSIVSPDVQAQIFIDTIKKNYETIVLYAQTKTKGK